jgi:hypothetical protein
LDPARAKINIEVQNPLSNFCGKMKKTGEGRLDLANRENELAEKKSAC